MPKNQSSSQFMPILKEFLNQPHIEGEIDSPVHRDPAQIPTIGSGINLEDPVNQQLLQAAGHDVESVKTGAESVPVETVHDIQNEAILRKQREVQNRYGSTFFDNLTPEQQAGVLSLAYNSRKVLGPKIVNAIQNQNSEQVLNELLFRSNPQKLPGVLARRLEEAKLLVPKKDFDDYMNWLDPEQKQKLFNMLSNTENEERRKQLLDQYGQMLDIGPKPVPFLKLKKLLNPTR